MAAGLPVVGVRSGGVPEMVTHGDNGLLSEPDDPEELAENILLLLKNESLAKDYGEKGRERAFHEFDPVKVSGEWADILWRRLGLPVNFVTLPLFYKKETNGRSFSTHYC
ncbi:MAG: glycosyltransferase family 4 protein [Chloroflexi bacterium]|nr:glycosyltransferase family 4 protein [Chloroflexota bacterium]